MIAQLSGVTYHYPGQESAALDDVTLDVAEGCFGLVAGPSAGGKSTFLRLFSGLVPQFHGGRLGGRMTVAGVDPARTPTRTMAGVAGFVFQEPEAQSVADTVEEDIAFGMEQQGTAPAEMTARMDELLGAMGIEALRRRQLATLSGGERQRVAIAAVLALGPRLLLLDEPTSQLDPEGAEAVVAALERLRRGGDISVLVAEHRLARLLPRVDSVYEVESGRVAQLTPREAAGRLRDVPGICTLGRRAGWDPLPLTVDEARARARGLGAIPAPPVPSPGDELLRVAGLSCRYGELSALGEVSLSLGEGELVALVGANGSGKTTLFRALAGLMQPSAGEVRFRGSLAPQGIAERTAFAGLVPQDPAVALYHESVADEVGDTLRARRAPIRVQTALDRWGLESLAERHPRDISVGQQQRVAVGAMLAHEPRVWLLDEPTRGADGEARRWLASRLRAHGRGGGAAIVATHDIESAAGWATRVIGLAEGRVAFDLPAREAMGAGGPVPTSIAGLVRGALTAEEVAL